MHTHTHLHRWNSNCRYSKNSNIQKEHTFFHFSSVSVSIYPFIHPAIPSIRERNPHSHSSSSPIGPMGLAYWIYHSLPLKTTIHVVKYTTHRWYGSRHFWSSSRWKRCSGGNPRPSSSSFEAKIFQNNYGWVGFFLNYITSNTPPKSNIDTNNDGLENVYPFKHGYFGYLC